LPKGPERIAFVTTSYPSRAGDPAGHFVEAEARREAQQGHRVTVLAPGRGTPPAPGANPRVIWIRDGGAFGWPGAVARLRHRPDRVWGMVRFVRNARAALDSLGELDRVVAHFIVPSAWPISSRSCRRLEVVAHGSDVRLLARLPRRARMRVLGELLAAGARFRVVSNELLDQLCSDSPAELRSRCSVRPCAMDLGTVPDREEARAQLGVSPDERLVVVVGRLVRGKRVGVALSAATLMPATRVVVIGTGPERRELGGRHPSVEFCGQLPRPVALRWMAAADALITASRDEGAPTVVREARAVGTPVVAAPSGDLAQWAATDPGISVIRASLGISTDRPFPWCQPGLGLRMLPWLCKGTTNHRSLRRKHG